MFINMNVSASKVSFDNSSRSVFFCPSTPHLIWDLKQTISPQLAIAVTTVACPFTILLNILVIVAVKEIRELQTNSNILITSLAVTDLLVGAVSMPLTITLDALILRATVSEDIICTINEISGFVLYTACSVSLFHLILIAWERYVAIVKCMEYKVIVTKGRVKRYAGIAWITALVINALYGTLGVVHVRYQVLLVVDVIYSLIWLICFSLHDGVFLSHDLYRNTKTEPNSNLPSKCSNQSKDRKQNCIHGVSTDSCRFHRQCSCSCFPYRGDIFAYFSSKFFLPMGRNFHPGKLSRESCALFL